MIRDPYYAAHTAKVASPSKKSVRRGKDLSKIIRTDPKETPIHRSVIDWLEHFGDSEAWDWSHPATGEKRDKVTAAKLKAMGVKPGRPDLELIDPLGQYHGLELKRLGGVLNEDQLKFQAKCQRNNWVYRVAYSVEEALEILSGWGVFGRYRIVTVAGQLRRVPLGAN